MSRETVSFVSPFVERLFGPEYFAGTLRSP
jgi:hypothetical protein